VYVCRLVPTFAEELHDGLRALLGQLGGRVGDMFLVKEEAFQAPTPFKRDSLSRNLIFDFL
jgi:hypothetical protein